MTACPVWFTACVTGALALAPVAAAKPSDPGVVSYAVLAKGSVGNVVGVQVDEKGVVSAIFDNSQVRKIAQVGIATFQNADGLMAQSGNSYQATLASGDYTIKQAGIGGAGQVASSSLEASTVDLSAEFTGLITTQKAYSASSKIITTADQMLEELINIKR